MIETKIGPDGLDAKEAQIMLHLVMAWNGFCELALERDDLDDFRRAIHEAQRILSMRIIGRTFPGHWRTGGQMERTAKE